MNYWERWIGAWKAKTAHLSSEEKGVYGELLDHEYATELPLPLDQVALERIAGAKTPSECKAVARIAATMFTCTTAGYINPRAHEEIERRRDYIARQRERGALGRAAQRVSPKGNSTYPLPPKRNVGRTIDVNALPDHWREFCASERPRLDADSTFFQFRDHWLANANQRGGKKANWDAAWRTWVRREKP